LDGVIHEFHVAPNQLVKAGDAIFSYDNEVLRSRLLVAQQSLASAQAEYRQSAQSALSDSRAKFQIASLVGKVQEKQAELKFLSEQVKRTTVTAPQAGMVLFDEASEWIGKPVQTGERVVRMADPADVELEVWVNLADAVPLKLGDEAKLFLTASPLDSVAANVRWVGYEAQPRPDGTFAYRIRASLADKTDFMVGTKGTVRVSAERVTLLFWLLRKPLAVVRGFLLL
jgi:multidrug efflux pump subunit AcrA (membrane-fusion protein)